MGLRVLSWAKRSVSGSFNLACCLCQGKLVIPSWFEHFIFTGTWSILYLFLAHSSLLYYIDRNQIEQDGLTKFFDNLSPPVRWGLRLAVWMLRDTHPLIGESIYAPTWPGALAMRLFFSLGAIMPTIGYSVYIVESNTTPEMISAGAGLIVAVYLFVRSWFFGHKLKYMQETSSTTEETN